MSKIAIAAGGSASFEWPRGCDGWKDPEINKVLGEIGLHSVDIDGCMCGVTSCRTGERIKKPWKIKSTNLRLVDALQNLLCDKTHTHSPCAGKDTRLSGFYPVQLAEIVLPTFVPQKLSDDLGALGASQPSTPSKPPKLQNAKIECSFTANSCDTSIRAQIWNPRRPS
jgi:hypothetical protein